MNSMLLTLKSYKKFIIFLYSYVLLNIRLFVLYVILLIVDSFAKIFATISIIPIVYFLSSDGLSGVDGGMLYIIEFLKYFNIDYNLYTAVMVLIFSTILGFLTEISFLFVSKINSYRILYFFTSIGLSRFFKKGLRFANSQSFGVMQNTFEREIMQISMGVDGLLGVLASLVQISMLIILAFSLSVDMSLITMGIMLITFILMSRISALLTEYSSMTTLSGNKLSQVLYEPLLNFKQVISYGKSDFVFNKHEVEFKRHSADAIRSSTISFLIPLMYRTIGLIGSLIALYISILMGGEPAILAAALIALIRITPIVSQISAAFASISIAIPSVDQFERLFGPIVEDQQEELKLRKYNGFSDSISAENITYFHSGDRPSVSNINFKIKKKSYVSIIGPSGSGKTTCIDILIGLLQPSSGSILIDNRPINEIDMDTFLDRVGYVQQTPFLFRGSIRDNLLWSNNFATEDEMWEALHLANIDSFIRSTQQQLDTQVGDRGLSLSGGQKQRIALAQALIRNPDILILDEATNSLDHESEELIMKTLQGIKHKVTIISITHKLSVARNSDMIIVIEQGRIVESGTYNELIQNNESFLKLSFE